MDNKLIKNWPITLLILISVIICFKNYSFGTFLSGWDTLHPEFNFGLNLQRVIFGVFRSEQGLGALAIHSHMSDLPRIIILYVFHFILPLSFLRYSYVFLNLILGPVGLYLFLNKYVTKDKIGSFLGSLFYLLNLGTMQQFIVPFEMFTTQYAALPWLFLTITNYLYGNSRKNLLFFSLAAFFSIPLAYAATLWYLQFLALIFYTLVLITPSLVKKNSKLAKKGLVLLALFLAINSFWLLPNLYSINSAGANVSLARINKLFSGQAFLYNKEFGNLADVSLMKTFLFDWSVFAGGNNFTSLLKPWVSHLNAPYVALVGYLFSLMALAGLILSAAKKEKIALAILPILILSLFFLINANGPTGTLYLFLQQKFPLFKEALRFPDDKVLGIFTFVFAVYFAFLQKFLLSFLKNKFLKLIPVLIFGVLLIYYMLPAFSGNFISPYMRVKIPNSYFETFSWFNSQKDDGRIANLPINSFWGWEYYDWYGYNNQPSYQGSGFLWFGIKQPLLARDFDRWTSYNEQYYREMSFAVYSKDPQLLKQVISKYEIHYILLDQNIIAPENDKKILFYPETQTLLNQLQKEGFLSLEKTFGKISIYHINKPSENAIMNIPQVKGLETAYYSDKAFAANGNYFSFPAQSKSLIDNQSKVFENLISQTDNNLKIKMPLTASPANFLASEEGISSDILLGRDVSGLIAAFYPKPPFPTEKPPSPLLALIKTNQENLILSINQKNNFFINSLPSESAFSLGSILLSTKASTDLAAYTTKEDQTVIPDFKTLTFSLSPCEGGLNQIFGLNVPDKEKNSFTLYGKQASVCMVIPLVNIFTDFEKTSENNLLTIGFNYQGQPISSVCLANLKTGACLENTPLTGNSFKNYFGFKSDDFRNLGVKISLDTTRSNKIENVTYRGFTFSLTKPFFESSFGADLIKESIGSSSSKSVNLISVPFSGDPQLSKNITNVPVTSPLCGPAVDSRSKIEKKIVQSSDPYIEYFVDQGNACDHFSYQNLSHDESYLVEIESRNVEGSPLTVCLLNYDSKRCDLYFPLPAGETFTKNYFLLPAMKQDQNGYDVDISSLGIKGSPSINDLRSITIIPFPYNWTVNAKLQVLEKKNVFVLPYSFDSGWKLYKTDSVLSKSLPFLFGSEQKEHVLVNGWANGWITSSNSSYTPVYLPQYLEYAGFTLLIAAFFLAIKPLFHLHR